MMRLTAYAGSSVALATGVLFKALNQRVNFYSACVYLSQSNACVIVMVNLLVLTVGTLVFGLQRLLYGPLRPIEAEQLYDRAWFAVTETCLAMTMFREEIGVWFILLFISLLVGKAWAWIGEGRVETLDQQPPANPRLFHIRLSVSLLLSLLFDLAFLDYSVSTVRHQARPTMMVMFAFEFAVLTAGSISTTLRYMISLRESAVIRQQTEQRTEEIRMQRRRERQDTGEDGQIAATEAEEDVDEMDIDVPGWEDKGRWVFYLELLTDLVRLVLYLTFFCVLCVFYGLPIYIIRDVAMAIRSFYKRITDFVKYKHATRDMNERYPDASAEDIHESDVCIICREAMTPWPAENQQNAGRPVDQRLRSKKLPCGHILHFACLRSWLERQQICPTCRQPVLGGQTTSSQRGPQPGNRDGPNAPDRPHARDEAPQPGAQDQRPAALPRGPQARPPPANGWRRLQLGPLRLEMGAWHGQAPHLPPDPVQQGHQVPQVQQPPRIALPGVASGPPRAQRAALGPATAESSTMQMQIDMIEHQVLQQINSLRITVGHLSRVRASQEELVRLHGLQHGGASPSVQVFRSDSSRTALHAGSDALPPGLTLPEGWSVLPLSRSGNSPAQSTNTPNAGQRTSSVDGRTVSADRTNTTPCPAAQSSDAAAQPSNVTRTDLPATTVDENSGAEVTAPIQNTTVPSEPIHGHAATETGHSASSDPRAASVNNTQERDLGVAGALPRWGSGQVLDTMSERPQVSSSEDDSDSEASDLPT